MRAAVNYHASAAIIRVAALTLALVAVPPGRHDDARAAEVEIIAAAEAGATVTGSGSVTLTRRPNVLRMTMVIPAEGKDVKEAIANLKTERTKVAGKLKELGAAEKSVTFDEPRVGPGGTMSAQQRMMAQVVRMQQGANRAAKKDDDAPAPVGVSVTVTAEWPLEEQESAEEFIVSGYNLREKVRTGGLSKTADKKELTPEEQEEMEEMADAMMDEDGTGAAAKPGEPKFAFVSKFKPEDRDAAMAEAFKRAKADAARLAAAAGRELGELRTVSGSASAAEGGDDDDIYAYQRVMMEQLGVNTSSGPAADEASAAEPGPVSLEVTVTAAFAMK